MANTPTPRSYNKVVGELADTVLFRLGLKKLKVGGPLLSLLEAAAMSDVRNSADIFNLLKSISLESAQGDALDRIARDENTSRFPAFSASGSVTITDSRYTKISTRIYQGKPSPIVGTATLYVDDASEMGATGSVYLGRGTSRAEGPLAYTAKTDLGGYWSLDLDTGSHTQYFHNAGESVVYAQGGDRYVGAGTVVQTAPNAAAEPTAFTTLYQARILDGEVSVEGVAVAAKKAGIGGNAPAEAVSQFLSLPFTGAEVSNALPFSNGQEVETDDELRVRIRSLRQSKFLGTATAIKTKAIGIVSPDENKRVSSASVVRRAGLPTTLYIDDGSGYEETDDGVAVESLTDEAVGGELSFKLGFRPVQEASVTTGETSPFALSDGAVLAVLVGGVRSEHTFAADEFQSITSATAFEVTNSINGNPDLDFLARTSNSGTTVTLFAKSDVNDDIEVVASNNTIEANDSLVFPAGRHDTIRLYKDDRPLSKDGLLASLKSNGTSSWGAISSSKTLTVSVDGTSAATYTFDDQDFVDAETGFATVGTNTPAAWAAVFNYKIPGVTATADETTVTLQSNLGRSNRASLSISGGTLVTIGMFDVDSATGKASDFTIDRYRGDIQLAEPLEVGVTLSAGSSSTRSFVESDVIDPVTLATDAKVYLAVDGDATIISTGITASDTFDITKPQSGAWGARYRITADAGTPFSNVLPGDWLVVWDSAVAWDEFRTILRIVAASTTWIEVEFDDPGGVTGVNKSFTDTGIAIVRYDGQLQELVVPSGVNYTADGFVSELNADVLGAEAETHHSNQVRIHTNSYSVDGDIAVVAVDSEGGKLEIAPADASLNEESRLGSVESGNSEIGTTEFIDRSVDASSAVDQIDLDDFAIEADHSVVGLKNHLIVASNDRYGNNRSFHSFIDNVVHGSPSDLTLRRSVPKVWQPQDRVYMASPYAITPEDDLTILVDDDVDTKKYSTAMWRALRPVGTTYGSSNDYKDIGDGSSPETYLAAVFGKDFNFDDFAIHMKARAKVPVGATGEFLARYKRFGPEGNNAYVGFTYPDAPSADLAVNATSLTDGDNFNDDRLTQIDIVLPSDTARSGYTIKNSSKMGFNVYVDPGTLMPYVTMVLGFSISSAQRTANVDTLTLTLPATTPANIASHGLGVGDLVWVNSNNVNFSSGLKTITGGNGTTTITYAETAADIGATANIGTVSFDTTSETNFATVLVDDLVHIESSTSLPSEFADETIQIKQRADQWIAGNTEDNNAIADDTTIHWYSVFDATKFSFYPLDLTACTTAAIVASINALDDLCPITATLLSADTVEHSTRDEINDLTELSGYQLVDGVNWVRTTGNPADLVHDYTLDFKETVDGSLTTGSDWDNEEVRLVPTTTKNVVDWLNALGVVGLSSVAEVVASSQAKKVQITTSTPGSDGSVQVQGGTANAVTSAVSGAATANSTSLVASFELADMVGFRGNQWVSLDNTEKMAKTGIFTSTTDLTSIATDGTFTLSGGSPAVYTVRGSAFAHPKVQVEKQGKFVFISGINASVAGKEGDWINITGPDDASTPVIGEANQGLYRIVRLSSAGVWIENAAAIEESEVYCGAVVLAADSLLPGDTVSINSDLWGVNNKGNWTVTFVGASDPFDDTHVFKVDVSSKAIEAVSAPGALGASEARKILAVEGVPTRLIKRIEGIVPNQEDPALADVRFDTYLRYGMVTEVAGTIMTALDKLDFPVSVSRGVDGYRYSTGLIGQTAKELYGDDADPVSYPGVIAEGAKINISGPIVRRVAMTLVIRAQSGVSRQDIAAQVKSTVASTINKVGVGLPVAISSIVEAAQSVNGVVAVSVRAPTYDDAHDLIAVQPNEKPLVLDIDSDIGVVFVDQ